MATSISGKSDSGADGADASELIELKAGVSGVRSVQVALMEMAYALARQPKRRGVLVLTHASVGIQRLRDEWQRAASVLRPELLNRLSICVDQGERFVGIPRDPDVRDQEGPFESHRDGSAARRRRGRPAATPLSWFSRFYCTIGSPTDDR